MTHKKIQEDIVHKRKWISTDMAGQIAPNNVENLFPDMIFPAAGMYLVGVRSLHKITNDYWLKMLPSEPII